MPRKRALVVGVDYRSQSIALNGCASDAYAWASYFEGAGYAVTLLVDDSQPLWEDRLAWAQKHGEPTGSPTRENILCSLVQMITSGAEELAFTFSGHGTQQADTSGDEADGMDEVLCPVDVQDGEYVTDDALRGAWQMMRPRQRAVVILDCCHSGTGMDLPYQLYERGGQAYRFVREARDSGDTPGDVLLLSGCQDNQTAAESSSYNAVMRRTESRGALSVAALKVLNARRGRVGVAQLLSEVRQALRAGGYTQTAQVSSGRSVAPGTPFL